MKIGLKLKIKVLILLFYFLFDQINKKKNSKLLNNSIVTDKFSHQLKKNTFDHISYVNFGNRVGHSCTHPRVLAGVGCEVFEGPLYVLV